MKVRNRGKELKKKTYAAPARQQYNSIPSPQDKDTDIQRHHMVKVISPHARWEEKYLRAVSERSEGQAEHTCNEREKIRQRMKASRVIHSGGGAYTINMQGIFIRINKPWLSPLNAAKGV